MATMNDWLEEIPSQQTRKNYRDGIRTFENYYREPVEELLKLNDGELGNIITKFFMFIKQSHSQSTARNQTNAVIQYLKHFGKNPKYKKSLGVYATTLTTRDHLLTVDEVREMWKIASLEEKVMIKTWLLGLRISDACKLEWQQFDLKPSNEPIEVPIHTRKEGITAHVFIDTEFQIILEKYLKNLDKTNKYLLQSEKGANLKEKQLLRKLQSLQKKAGIDTHGKRFGWHLGRKLFLRCTSELRITRRNAQLMVGKSVDKSKATYINGVQLMNDAKKVHNVLRMEVNGNGNKMSKLEDLVLSLEKENATLKQRIEILQKHLDSHESMLMDINERLTYYEGHGKRMPIVDRFR